MKLLWKFTAELGPNKSEDFLSTSYRRVLAVKKNKVSKKLGCAFESSSVVQASKRNRNRPAVNNQGERKNEVRGGLIQNASGIPIEDNTNRPERTKETTMKHLETVLTTVRNNCPEKAKELRMKQESTVAASSNGDAVNNIRGGKYCTQGGG